MVGRQIAEKFGKTAHYSLKDRQQCGRLDNELYARSRQCGRYSLNLVLSVRAERK
jgi:hypothetical protein